LLPMPSSSLQIFKSQFRINFTFVPYALKKKIRKFNVSNVVSFLLLRKPTFPKNCVLH